jgi:hydrogenase maturation protease
MKRSKDRNAVSHTVVIIGYGNLGRQDDGLGFMMAEGIDALGLPSVTSEADMQLQIEDAATISEHDIAIFVDAEIAGPEPFSVKRIKPSPEISFTSHSVTPESIIAICEDHLKHTPQAWLVGIRGYSFEFCEGLPPKAQKNYDAAFSFLKEKLTEWSENPQERLELDQ